MIIYKQLILICLLWIGAKACTRNETETNSNSTESSRQKRSCLGVISRVQYCEGTLEFIPSILGEGRRKIFMKQSSRPAKTKTLRKNTEIAEYAIIKGNCCFKVTDKQKL